MKKAIISLLVITTAAVQAKTITLGEWAYNGPSWAYVWDNSGTQWGHIESSEGTSLIYNSYAPSNNDPSFVGYTFAMVDNVQTLTSMNTTMTVAAPTWIGPKGTYLAGGVTLTGTDNGIRANSFVDFADIVTSQLAYTGRFWKQGDVSVTGSLTLADNGSFEHVFFSASTMEQNAGVWDFSNFSITDANGNALTYTSDAQNIGKAGYFWVEETDFTQGASYSATLVARAIPEPTTATLSLLALAGLAARRRRR